MMRRGVLVAGARPRPASIHHTCPFTTTRHLLSNSKVDVLIIGSGAGSLTAALRAKHHNLRVAVIEKQPTIGGASAISGGGLWIPNNPVSNVKDSKQDALDYFDQAVGDVGPASSLARRHAYLDNAPKMIAFLQEKGFEFRPSDGYPDYYPKMKGAMGKGGGRTIESKAFNTKKLDKKWQDALPPPTTPVAIYTNQAPVIMRMTSSLSAFTQSVRAVLPSVLKMLIGQKPTSFGRALVARLLYLNTHSSSPTDIRLSTSLASLTTDSDGTVTGAKVKTPTGEETIAARSVILAAGGFAQNASLRQKHLPSPATTTWTSSPKGDTGDAVVAGINLGAATALMDDAWWGPTIFDPVTGKPHFALIERSRPHCIIVDSAGKRFMNEAESYTDAGHDQYKRNEKVKAIPAWLIMDSNHRNRYMLGTGLFARQKPPKKALEEGKMFMAGSLGELGSKIGVDVKELKETVEKYNVMCERGVDEEFGKGDSAYDNFFGDPDAGGLNPNMGPLNRAPFYAIAIWPGDLGTKGGLLTDEHQRVLRENESIIPGLYAIGNTAASIMGRTYLGAGSTLGPAMTHGFVEMH